MRKCRKCHELKREDAFKPGRNTCIDCYNARRRELGYKRQEPNKKAPTQTGITKQNIPTGWGF